MRANHITIIVCAVSLVFLASDPSLPQQMHAADDSLHTVHQPYDIETFGEFRRIMIGGDFGAKVSLDAVMAKHPTTGVGALSGARGEITIYDGKLIVSYGKAGAVPDQNSESAALLVVGSVGEWQSVQVERDVAPNEVESYIVIAAKTHGIDPEESFPFEVRGSVAPYVMHVNAAPIDKEHGMGMPMAITVESHGDQIDGVIAGLYASLDLMGIATHGGERTHAHWISTDLASTAHLDRWGLRSGAILMLPKPVR
jgi:alpha-acetolactate decarboxylase